MTFFCNLFGRGERLKICHTIGVGCSTLTNSVNLIGGNICLQWYSVLQINVVISQPTNPLASWWIFSGYCCITHSHITWFCYDDDPICFKWFISTVSAHQPIINLTQYSKSLDEFSFRSSFININNTLIATIHTIVMDWFIYRPTLNYK